MTVVYIDMVFLLNSVIDYLLLLATAQLLGLPLQRWRMAVAGGFGGLYATLIFPAPCLNRPIIRIMMGVALSVGAFGGTAAIWRPIALFFLLSGALAGLLMALEFLMGGSGSIMQVVYHVEIHGWVLILSAMLFYGLLDVLFHCAAKYGRSDLVKITVLAEGRKCHLRALRDTGNSLRNPIDGKPVLVAERAVLRALWSDRVVSAIEQEVPPEDKIIRLCKLGCSRFSLLPFRTIENEGGLLLAYRSDYIIVNRRVYRGVLIALASHEIGGAAYNALWGEREEHCGIVQSDFAMDSETQVG